MKKYWIVKAVKITFFVVFFTLVFGFVTMKLWNWLMPAVFGLGTISIWQAFGLLVLSRILFGGFFGKGCGGRNHWKGHWKHRMKEKFANMSPEEQQAFKERMGRYCGPWGAGHHHRQAPESDQSTNSDVK